MNIIIHIETVSRLADECHFIDKNISLMTRLHLQRLIASFKERNPAIFNDEPSSLGSCVSS